MQLSGAQIERCAEASAIENARQASLPDGTAVATPELAMTLECDGVKVFDEREPQREPELELARARLLLELERLP